MGWEPIIFLTVIGFGIFLLFKPRPEKFHGLSVIVLSFWLGTLVTAFLMIGLAVVTGRFFFPMIWLLLIGGFLLILFNVKKIYTYFPYTPPGPLKKDKIFLLLYIPLIYFIIVNLYRVEFLCMDYPLVSIDAIGNFALKGKLWYYTNSLFPAQLLDPEYLMYKRCHPPIISVIESLWASFEGWQGRDVKYFFFTCWLSVGLAILSILRSRGNRFSAVLATTIWFALPYNLGYCHGGAISGYADVPLALTFLCAVLIVDKLHNTDKWSDILLMALLLGGTFWVKKEGIPFVFFIMLFLVYKRMAIKKLGVLVSVLALMYIVYLFTTFNIPCLFEKDVTRHLSCAELFARIQRLFPLVVAEFSDPRHWGNRLWLIVLGAWILKLYRRKVKNLFNLEAVLFVFMFSLYLIVLVFTVWDFEQNLRWASHRLFIQIYPLLLIATFDGMKIISEPRIEKR